jgi:hypothetical protein
MEVIVIFAGVPDALPPFSSTGNRLTGDAEITEFPVLMAPAVPFRLASPTLNG